MNDSEDGPKPKSRWDKIDIILRPVGGLLTALSVALVGFLCTSHLESWRAEESNVRLYAELMSTREASDSALRQEMFNTIVSRFLNPDISATPESVSADDTRTQLEVSVLRLEMLAYNFHDSLDLSPLFKDVQRKLTRSDETENMTLDKNSRDDLLKRLEKVAGEVSDKQLATLEEGNNIVRAKFDINGEDGFIRKLMYETLCYENGGETFCKAFSVDVISIHPENKEVQVRLTVWNVSSSGTEFSPDPVVDVPFSVGFFDFPLVDNSRIGHSERCALVLSEFGDFVASLSLVYFPGSRASLKEKRYYDDIIQELQQMNVIMKK